MTDSFKVLDKKNLFYSQSTSSAVICLHYKKNVLRFRLCIIIQFIFLCSWFSCCEFGCSVFHCLDDIALW